MNPFDEPDLTGIPPEDIAELRRLIAADPMVQHYKLDAEVFAWAVREMHARPGTTPATAFAVGCYEWDV